MKRYMWKRYLYNAYEPDNYMCIEGNEDENNLIKADYFLFSGVFNDGEMNLEISRLSTGKFRFFLDDEVIIFDTLDEALSKMPSFLMSPDYFEDGELIDISEFVTNLD